MISLYSGTPGSGKSLHLAQRIYNKLRRGECVIANFEINLKKVSKNTKDLDFLYIDNLKIKPKMLINFSKEYFCGRKVKEDEILLVFDECQIIFNARDWQAADRREWISFFSQHRKYGYEIILVAQFDLMIDKQLRSLIEYEYKHRKTSNFGIFGTLITLLALGNVFVAVKIWYPMQERVGSDFFKARKKYYEIYDTFNTFD